MGNVGWTGLFGGITYAFLWGARDVIVIVVGNGHGKLVYVSHSANTLGKGISSTILPLVGKNGLFNLGMTTGLREEMSEFKPVKLLLKINPVSYPARAEGAG